MKTITHLSVLLCFLSFSFSGYAQIAGAVFRDYNHNGTRQTLNPNEPGISGITVNAYNTADVLIASYQTSSDGTYSMPATGSTYNGTLGSNTGAVRNGQKVRLEFVVANTNVIGSSTYQAFPTFLGSENGSSVQFVTGGASAININYAVNNPADYAEANPKLAYNTYVEGHQVSGTNANRITLNYMPYSLGNVAGSASAGKIPVSTAAQIGTTYGITHQKGSNSVFSSALMKRHVGFGPAGTGAIYRSDLTAGTTVTFLDLNTLLGAGTAGTDPHPLTATAANWRKDSAAWDPVGKISLGDLDISEDEKTLWTINLADRKLYKIPIGSATNPVAPTAGQIERFPASGNLTGLAGLVGTNLADDIRPFGLGIKNGLVYIGLVHTSQTAQLVSELHAFVYSFNPSTQVFTKVLDFPLNYPRHFAVNDGANSISANWQPWKSVFTIASNATFGNEHAVPQAILSDISFNGDIMQLGFRDRYGDQMGFAQQDTDGAGSYSGTTAGDLLYASPNGASGWNIESNAQSNPAGTFGPSTGAGNLEGPDNGEYIFRDKFPISQTTYSGTTFIMHDEVVVGGLAQIPGYNDIAVTSLDPADDFNAAFDAGISWFNNTTGDRSRGFMVFNGGATSDPFLGKANGVGDIEFVSAPAPNEIGNRVWNDYDEDGVQDADENGIADVIVELYADFDEDNISDGMLLATDTTDSKGNWAFNSSNIIDGDPTIIGFQAGLKAGKQYIVSLATTEWSGVSGLNALTGFYLSPEKTITGAGQDELIDSDAAIVGGVPQISALVGAAGEGNHSFDFGFFTPKMVVGDYVWIDTNQDGVQDASETGASGVTVSLIDLASNQIINVVKTDATGHYYFDEVTEGDYQIQVTLPTDYVFSPTTGGNESTDSDVLSFAGKTGTFTIIPFQDTLGIDAGIYFQPQNTGSFGDFVWYDTNKDGIQDAGEAGVANVTVTLFNNAGNIFMTTKTDQTGKYLFQNIAAGDYQMGITPPVGYTFSPQDQGGNDNLDSDINLATGRTAFTSIVLGEQDLSWDVALIPQTASQAAIGDFVWNDFNLNGIQDAGEPGIAGVQVILYDGLNSPIDTTYSDGYGNYVFYGINGGAYYLSFTLPSGYAYSSANQGTNDDLDSDILGTGKTDRILLGAGEILTNIDAALYLTSPVGTANVGDKVWLDGNLDGLQDANEAGVAGVTVTLLNSSFAAVATSVTDSKGNYRFWQLGAGNYYIQFSNVPQGFSFTTKDADGGAGNNTDSDANAGNGMSDLIVLAAAETNTSIDAGLIQQATNGGKGSIGNFVWYDTDRDGIQDATEPGIANVTVSLVNVTTSATQTLTTDGTGYYIFNNLDAGAYRLNFTTPAGYSISLANQGTDDAKDSDIDGTGNAPILLLAAGEWNDKIDAGMYITALTNPVTIGNFVWIDSNQNGAQDGGEVGMPGVTVTLYDNLGQAIQSTTTDYQGNYYFTGIAAGDYVVGFSNLPAGYDFSAQDNAADDNIDSDADTHSGRTDVLTLAAGQTLLNVDAGISTSTKSALGNFVWFDNDADGLQNNNAQGVAGITVVLLNTSNTPIISAITDANGFYFFPNVAPATYSIRLNNLPAGTKFTVQNMGTEDVDSDINTTTSVSDAVTLAVGQVNLDLDAGFGTPISSTLTGYFWYDYITAALPTNMNGLQDVGEKPAVGATLGLYDITGTTLVSTTVSAANGNYVFSNLTNGTYTVKAIALPLGTRFTIANAGGLNDSTDSDFVVASADAGNYAVGTGQNVEGADGGLIPPASAQGMAFNDGKPNTINTADGIRNYPIPTDLGSGIDLGMGNVIVILLDETGTILANTRTDDSGQYRFAGMEAGKVYNMAFEPNPGNCLLCDFTLHNAEIGNDTTDSDVDTTFTISYLAKSFALTDSVKNLLPYENRKFIDAGYRLPGSAFPVELTSLNAEWKGVDGFLTWQTATETNSKYFSIERTLDNGQTFTWLGNVQSNGNSTETKSYSFTDIGVKNITENRVYYRLKMVDIDASYKYSELVELRVSDFTDNIYFNAYPNPTSDLAYIDYHVTGAEIVEIRLLNTLGQVLYTENIKNTEKPQQTHIDLRDLSDGLYFIYLVTENRSLVHKIQKN